MFTKPDNTYNDIREKSLMQWLDEMEQHSDAEAGEARVCGQTAPAQRNGQQLRKVVITS